MTDDVRPSYLEFLATDAPAHLDPRFPPFHRGWRKAEHASGVGFFGPWEEVYAGFPEHVRRCAMALAHAGMPVHLRSSRGGLQFQTTKDEELSLAFERMKDELEPLLNAEIKSYKADIWQMVADDAAFHRIAGPTHHYLNERELQHIYKRRIISTVFERESVSRAAASCLAAVGQVWVANQQDRQMLEDSGIAADKLRVVPIPFFPTDPHLQLRDKPRFAGPVRFYHVGKWEPRKAQHEMLGAWLRAFRPGENAQLFLKTSASSPVYKSGYPESPQHSLRHWLKVPTIAERGWTEQSLGRHVFLIQQRLSPARMIQLHRTGDVYVSLSRGEGFDMPAFDAKLAGKRMVYTPSGGPQDFADEGDVIVPRSGSVPTDPFYGWRSSYLDYEPDMAERALRLAYQAEMEPCPRQACPTDERFTAKAVGAAMAQHIEELCS